MKPEDRRRRARVVTGRWLAIAARAKRCAGGAVEPVPADLLRHVEPSHDDWPPGAESRRVHRDALRRLAVRHRRRQHRSPAPHARVVRMRSSSAPGRWRPTIRNSLSGTCRVRIRSGSSSIRAQAGARRIRSSPMTPGRPCMSARGRSLSPAKCDWGRRPSSASTVMTRAEACRRRCVCCARAGVHACSWKAAG